MRDSAQSATVVWLGILIGIAHGVTAWTGPLTSSSDASAAIVAMVERGPFTLPLYIPVLLGLYALNAGIPLRCIVARGAYIVYGITVGLACMSLEMCSPGSLADASTTPPIAIATVISCVIAYLIYRTYRGRSSSRALPQVPARGSEWQRGGLPPRRDRAPQP